MEHVTGAPNAGYLEPVLGCVRRSRRAFGVVSETRSLELVFDVSRVAELGRAPLKRHRQLTSAPGARRSRGPTCQPNLNGLALADGEVNCRGGRRGAAAATRALSVVAILNRPYGTAPEPPERIDECARVSWPSCAQPATNDEQAARSMPAKRGMRSSPSPGRFGLPSSGASACEFVSGADALRQRHVSGTERLQRRGRRLTAPGNAGSVRRSRTTPVRSALPGVSVLRSPTAARRCPPLRHWGLLGSTSARPETRTSGSPTSIRQPRPPASPRQRRCTSPTCRPIIRSPLR